MTDPEYVARLVAATRIADPKRVEIHFKTDFSIIVEARDIPGLVQMEPVKEPTKIVPDENPEAKKLVDWLTAYRIKESISIDELARKTGISPGSLKAYFAGKRLPGQIGLGRIRKFKEDSESSGQS